MSRAEPTTEEARLQRWAGFAERKAAALAFARSATTRPPPRASVKPVTRERWPLLARAVGWLRSPEDKGVGDTVARCLDAIGAKTLAEAYEMITGKPCGCGDRQAKLNQLYSY